jgi:hypothetical protein
LSRKVKPRMLCFYLHCRHTNARTGRDNKIRSHIKGLQAFGLTVTITGDEQAA